MFMNFSNRGGIRAANGSQQVLSLMFELFEVGADRKVTIVKYTAHNGPPRGQARSPLVRAKEVRVNLVVISVSQVDSVLPADWRRPVRRG